METQTVTLFFALLAIVAEAAVVVALALWLRRRSASGLPDRALQSVGPQALGLAAAVAAVCTAGSLYLSEVAHFPPCSLCWYQRIAMYPLVVILGIAAWRRDFDVAGYVAPLCLVGGAISAYHLAVERMPSLGSGACDPDNPCSIIWVQHFGYLTIPAMALSGFALIATLVLVARAWGADRVEA